MSPCLARDAGGLVAAAVRAAGLAKVPRRSLAAVAAASIAAVLRAADRGPAAAADDAIGATRAAVSAAVASPDGPAIREARAAARRRRRLLKKKNKEVARERMEELVVPGGDVLAGAPAQAGGRWHGAIGGQA